VNQRHSSHQCCRRYNSVETPSGQSLLSRFREPVRSARGVGGSGIKAKISPATTATAVSTANTFPSCLRYGDSGSLDSSARLKCAAIAEQRDRNCGPATPLPSPIRPNRLHNHAIQNGKFIRGKPGKGRSIVIQTLVAPISGMFNPQAFRDDLRNWY